MGRSPRIVLPGVAHHVTQRGNDRQDVFFSDRDRAVYLKYLRQNCRREGVALSAYCLMTNHVHLILTPEREESLSRALGQAHHMYAMYVFASQERSGHLWQSRFYSCPLDEAHEHNATAYLELNPVRAGIVEAPWEYPWSSAAVHCGLGGDGSGMLDLETWFRTYSIDTWRGTLAAVGGSEEMLERIRLHTYTGRPLGNDSFLQRIETMLNRSVRRLGRGRPKGSKDKQPRTRRRRAELDESIL